MRRVFKTDERKDTYGWWLGAKAARVLLQNDVGVKQRGRRSKGCGKHNKSDESRNQVCGVGIGETAKVTMEEGDATTRGCRHDVTT
jgi:hypothetical protein